ncbi:hypothetical protein D0Z07_4532, partial [Hyphodiscus hymeniophilus]
TAIKNIYVPKATPCRRRRPLYADFAPRAKPSSMLFSMLPSAVQSRLPRLSSLRKSVSMYGLATVRRGHGSRGPWSGSRTPDMAMVLSGARPTEELGYEIDSLSSDDELTKLDDAGMRRPMVELTESTSGIGWKFANQGLNLLSLTVEESTTMSQDPRFGNPDFARQLYLHALTYLIRGLPSDLTTEEQFSVRSALPIGVVDPLQLKMDTGIESSKAPRESDAEPSLLHRTLASTIVQLFILFQFLLPYLKYLLSAAYQYEREHKISEKVLSQSIETVDTIGKRSLSITGAIYGMGDGKVGQIITHAASWIVEGVTGGIHEGVGEGMVIMGARRASPSGIEKR